MTKKQKNELLRLIAGAVLFAAAFLLQKLTDLDRYVYIIIYMLPYIVLGWDVLYGAVRNIFSSQIFGEDLLMSIATVGAFAVGEYPEAVFVMLFFQTGELFQKAAVGKSRKSIAALMDIRPDTACVIRNAEELIVSPEEVKPGEAIIVRAGEKIPLDGRVLSGESSVDTRALTGESVPRSIKTGDDAVSGCVNISGVLKIEVTREFGESTVAKILELVENSSLRKAKAENFITKFARYYTPSVVTGAVLLAVIPSLITGSWSDWIYKALIFLVVSCPCALVISVPLTFFCGIGGASSRGILVKGANYLEAIADADTVVFDKTGTLTEGVFEVTSVHPSNGFSEKELLKYCAAAEKDSPHPVAVPLRKAADTSACGISDTCEIAGNGVKAKVDGKQVAAGNAALMNALGVAFTKAQEPGTVVYAAVDSVFAGYIVISDKIKKSSALAVKRLTEEGVSRIVMLTGDRKEAAESSAEQIGITEVLSQLLPDGKVEAVEKLLNEKKAKRTLIFVGDGINDAPVLTRADVGIAMGALGSDAAIEAADAVIMDDDPAKIALAVKIARRTKRIVRENVVFALAVKFAILVLAALGFANMWLGVFADVGVAVIAIINAMRALRMSRK